MKTKEVIPSPPTLVAVRGTPIPPLPADALLLSLDDVGGYLRRSRAAVKKMLDSRPGAKNEDEVGVLLRQWVVRMTDHRRYILREPFIDWYRSLITNRSKQ